MNFNKMFHNSFSDIFPVRSDNELFKSVVERTENMNKKKINIRKASAIIAVAAAVLLLGITAAAHFDISSLFEKSVDKRAEDMEEFSEEYYDIIENRYPEINEINIPEETVCAEVGTEIKAEPEKSISERISNEYKKSIVCDGYTIEVKGYVYDGYGVQIFMDLIFDENGKYYENGSLMISEPGNLFTVLFTAPNSKGFRSGGTGQVITVNGNIITYKAILNVRACNGTEGLDGLMAVIIPDEKTDEALKNENPEDYSVPLIIPEISDLIYEEETDKDFELVGLGTARLKKFVISPLQITLTFDSDIDFKISDKEATPCYVTMKNGEVLDLSYAGTSQSLYADKYELSITSGDIAILDINEIKSVQIYNEVFEIK